MHDVNIRIQPIKCTFATEIERLIKIERTLDRNRTLGQNRTLDRKSKESNLQPTTEITK